MNPARPEQELQKLRSHRVGKERDLSLCAMLAAQVDGAVKQRRAIGGMGQVWNEVVPTGLRERARVRSFTRGVLTIETPDASARYEVDRWLRSGGLADLQRRAPRTLSKVKIV